MISLAGPAPHPSVRTFLTRTISGITMRSMQPLLSFRFFVLALATAACLSGPAIRCLAADQPDGAALYRKHCASCHPEEKNVDLSTQLIDRLRLPFVGMPTFGPEKLSDDEVRAIDTYLQLTRAAAQEPEEGPKAPPKPRRSPKEKKSWMRGFGTD